MEFLILATWVAVGFGSFVYWWTKDFDFTPGDLFAAVLISTGGPFAFLVGWALHGGRSRALHTSITANRLSRVLIPRRLPKGKTQQSLGRYDQ